MTQVMQDTPWRKGNEEERRDKSREEENMDKEKRERKETSEKQGKRKEGKKREMKAGERGEFLKEWKGEDVGDEGVTRRKERNTVDERRKGGRKE